MTMLSMANGLGASISVSDDQTEIAYDASGRELYVGTSLPGTAFDAAGWKIKKLIYDVTSGKLLRVRFASNKATYTHKWTERESFIYE